MEEAHAELERLVARIQANNDEAEAIQAEFTALIDRLMAGGPDERQLARQALATWAEAGITEGQHIRDSAQNRIDGGLL